MAKSPPESDKKPGSGLSSYEMSSVIVEAAVQVATSVKAQALLLYADAIGDLTPLAPLAGKKTKVIFVARSDSDLARVEGFPGKVLSVPAFNLTRMGQIKMATLMAFSQRMLRPGDSFVFLTGTTGNPLDTMVVMSVGAEYELFQSVDQPTLTEHIRRVVFERAMTIVLELANEGREGKPVGAIFVIGDTKEVSKYCQQNIMNPFKGYTEKERNILDDHMRETIKEFCSIDGAFVIKGNGAIVSAGTYLRSTISLEELPQGLGARHAAAAAVTAATKSLAITLSESTGTVRVWRLGQLITEIEKASRGPAPQKPAPTGSG